MLRTIIKLLNQEVKGTVFDHVIYLILSCSSVRIAHTNCVGYTLLDYTMQAYTVDGL